MRHLLLLAIPVGFFLVLETLLRGFVWFGGDLPWPPSASAEWAQRGYRLDPELSWAFLPGVIPDVPGTHLPTNERGLRDDPVVVPKPASVVRVLALGDSTVFGFGVRREESFVERLEALLNQRGGVGRYEVVNAGVPGYSVFNSLQYLRREGIQLEPDLILFQSNFNDRRYVQSADQRDESNFHRDLVRRVRLRDGLGSSYLVRGLRKLLVGIGPGDSLVDSGEFDFDWIELDRLQSRVNPERYRVLVDELLTLARARDIPVVLIAHGDPPHVREALDRAEELERAGDLEAAIAMLQGAEVAVSMRVVSQVWRNGWLERVGREDEQVRRIRVPIRWMGTDGNIPIQTSDAYTDILWEFDARPGVGTVGLRPTRAESDALYLDYIHPSAEGHRRLANDLFDLLVHDPELSLVP